MTRRQHFVTFYSPGTFYSEDTRKPLDAWDTVAAVKMASRIVERYNATPYGFRFSTCIVSDPIPDGEGGTLEVEEKEVAKSGMYFIGGDLLRLDDVPDSGETRILHANMSGNDWPIMCDNRNSWRSTQPFNETDFIVNDDGTIRVRGDDPELVEYRKRKIEEHRRELEEWAASRA